MPLGYHYIGKHTLSCRVCRRTLAPGEYYWGYDQGFGHNPTGTCLRCKEGRRFFTEAVAARISGLSREWVGQCFRGGEIPHARKVSQGHVLIPLPWILEQKAAHE